jgi:hypothetical protein
MRRRIAGHVRNRNRASAWATRPDGTSLASRAVGALGSLVIASILALAGPAAADPASPDPDPILANAAMPISPAGLRSLEALLSVPPVRDERTAAERTDVYLAEAVARRGGDTRVSTTGFKKRSIDLFRAERPVEVGQQEMLLRLRLRAKSRETMSVELRY